MQEMPRADAPGTGEDQSQPRGLAAWRRGTRLRHGRNGAVIGGPDLDRMVAAVACWTWNGAAIGGTATGMTLGPAWGRRSSTG